VKLPVAYNYLPILNAPIGKAIYYYLMAAATALQRLRNPDELPVLFYFWPQTQQALLQEQRY
jgi:hypothetical protein